MKNFLLLGMMLICSMILWNCSDDKDDDKPGKNKVATRLHVSATELIFDTEGGEKAFNIESDGEWLIEPTSDWCVLSAVSGSGDQSITINVGEYDGTDDRNVVFTVKAGSQKSILTVIQKHKDALILDKDKFDVSNKGGYVGIQAKSTVECTLFIPVEFRDWISEVPNKSRALMEKTFNLMIAESKDYNERSGFVEINGGELKDTVYIYQAPAGQLILVEDSYWLNSDAQQMTVELKTNVDYDVVIPESAKSWISLIASRAIRTDKLNLSIKENKGSEWREAEIVLRDKNEEATDTLYIKQAPEGLFFLAKDHYEVESAGATIELELLSGVEKFETKILNGAEDWLKIESNKLARSLTKHHLRIVVAQNKSVPREGRVVFTDGESGDTLKIVQAGHVYTLSFSESNMEVPAQGKTIDVILKSDVDYQLSIDGNWITQIASEIIAASGLKEEKLQFKIDPNETQEVRTGKIIVKDKNSELTATLDITQRRKPSGSVYEGNLKIETEADLNRFLDNGYTVVDGNLTIGGNTLSTLAALNGQLQEITGNLIIDCTSLKDFKGFEALTTISGDFEILNGSFTSFAGLEKLTTLDGSLRVNAVADADGQTVLGNLSSFEGLSGLKMIGKDIEVSVKNTIKTSPNYALTNLASFKGLDNLTQIGGKLKISGNVTTQGMASTNPLSKFASFGLEKLETIEGDFEINLFASVGYDIRFLQTLRSFEGLNALKKVGGNFKIAVSITTVGQFVEPWGLAKLASFAGLESLETVGGDFIITGNAVNNGGGVGGDGKPMMGYSKPKVLTDLTTLKGLDNLKAVSGQNFKISGCPKLDDFSALKNVLSNYSGSFSVTDCSSNPSKGEILGN